MTEDEAKTKSCCGPMQSDFGKTHVVNCIGSACMAWRELFEAALDGEEAARLMNLGEPFGIVRLRKDGGYCGLAGKP